MKKRILFILLLLFVGLTIAYIARYLGSRSLEQRIPEHTDAAIRIDVRQLEQDMLHDVIFHPFDYFNPKESDISKTEDVSQPVADALPSHPTYRELLDAIEVPKSIYLFRPEASNAWYSSKIKIKDQSLLEQIASAQGYTRNESKAQPTYENGDRKIVLDGDVVRFVYGSMPVLSDAKGYLRSGSRIYDSMDKSKSDIIYADSQNNTLEVFLEDGKIELQGNYAMDFLHSADSFLIGTGLGSIGGAIDISKLKNHIPQASIAKFTNFTKLEMDSIEQYFDGKVLGAFQGYIHTSDTITTYEYDDDFNKVEVQQIKEHKIPDFSVYLGMSAEGMEYLARHKAIVEQEGRLVFTRMPLATTYVEYKDNMLHLFTGDAVNKRQKTTDLLKGHVDIEALKKTSKGLNSKMLEPIQTIDLSIDKDHKIHGQITLTEDRHPLSVYMR